MRVPVMMVHGMCCTGDVWRNFRGFFEERGARVYTPTLRPEVRVRENPPKALAKLGVEDYVADLKAEVMRIEDECGEPPVVIGHSMGGLLAQRMAAGNLVQAAVFISPTPPRGARTALDNFVFGAVGVLQPLGLMPRVILPRRAGAQRSVFNVTPQEDADEAYAGMVCESGRVLDDFGKCHIDETDVKVPVLTVAATQDKLVPAKSVRKVGKKYEAVGGEFVEYAEHAHWLYGEPGWEKPAADIHAWFGRVLG